MKLALFVLYLSITSVAGGQCLADGSSPSNGIFVALPKVYDDFYLQSQLNNLKARLGAINAADQGTLLGKVGQIQGGTLNQFGLSVQALGPTPAQTSTLTPPTTLPSYATSSSATPPFTVTGPYGTTTTSPTPTPAVPAAPTPSLTLPSTFSSSALDTLNEEMQLSYQIIGIQLLLDGALNDRFIPGSQQAKRRLTVGFDITIDPCLGNNASERTDSRHSNRGLRQWRNLLKDHVAEVEIAIQNPPDSGNVSPSIVTLLPREKTYNVASLTDKSISIGAGGIIAGVLNLGGGFLRGTQKFYLVAQQDTLALEKTHSSFVWQFRPVLNQNYVQAGTRQNFVQFALPMGIAPSDCGATVTITTSWRKIDAKTGILGPPEFALSQTGIQVPYIDPTQISQAVDVQDVGGGIVSVRINGGPFLDGTQVRIGSAILSPILGGLRVSNDIIEFTASAKDIVAGGAFLINRDGSETLIHTPAVPSPLAPCGPQRPPAPAGGGTSSLSGPTPNNDQAGDHQAANQLAYSERYKASVLPFKYLASIQDLEIKPYSDTQALISFKFTEANDAPVNNQPGQGLFNPIVVSIGAQVFGLQNAPLRSLNPSSHTESEKTWEISLVVPSELLRANRSIVVQRLFWDEHHVGQIYIPANQFPKVDFAVTGAMVVSVGESGDYPYKLLVTGTGLDHAKLEAPACASIEEDPKKTYSYLFVHMKKECKDAGKTLVFTTDATGTLPITQAIPALDDSAAKTPKAPIDPLNATVAPGVTALSVTGPALDQISWIKYGKIRLQFTIDLAKKSLNIALTPDITAVEAIRYLDIQTTDGKKYRFQLIVKKP